MVTPLIRVYDVETTGKDPATDRIVEIASINVFRNVLGNPQVDYPISTLVNPLRPIPPEAMAVHHITDHAVQGAYVFRDVWPEFEPGDDVVAVAAHNWAFDSGFLPEMKQPAICTYKAALRVWPEAPGHSNQVLRYWLGLDVNPEGSPHRAAYDAEVTAHILIALMARASLKEMVNWALEPALQPVCKIGKHKGTPWPDVPIDFLEWVLRQDFDEDTRWNVTAEIERRKVKA